MVKAQEYIKKILTAQRLVEAAMRKEARCRSLAEKVTATMNSEMVSGSRNVTAHEDQIIRLMEAAQETEQQLAALEVIENDFREKLVHVDTPDGGTVLYLHVIDRKKIAEIADVLFCSKRQVYRKLEAAMMELDAML